MRFPTATELTSVFKRGAPTARATPRRQAAPAIELIPVRPGRAVAGGALMILATVLISLTASVTVLSRLENLAAQQGAFDQLHEILAKGTAPVSTIGPDGRPLADGRPVALLSIPAIGLEQTVLFGTNPGVLMDGPGLRRDSVMPGQLGAAVIMGRAWSYGGAFNRIAEIPAGSAITVTTGQGQSNYRTLNGPRYAEDPAPPPPGPADGRLILVSSFGPAFIPSGTVRIDAELTSPAQPTPARLGGSILQPSEQAMGVDASQTWLLVLLLQLMLAVTVAAVVAWYRWGRIQTWIVFAPLLLYVGLGMFDQLALFLPNLL